MDEARLRACLSGRAIEAVVIGASAGGVAALLEILPGLPRAWPLPVVAVLHLMAGRQSQLAEVFGQRMALPVREARDKESVAPGTVYFAGSGYHLSVETDRSFSLSCEAPCNFARPAIDFTMTPASPPDGRPIERRPVIWTPSARSSAAPSSPPNRSMTRRTTVWAPTLPSPTAA